MATLRKQAQTILKGWKKRHLMRNYQLASHAKVRDSEVSRVLTGNGYISDAVCQKIIDAGEPKC